MEVKAILMTLDIVQLQQYIHTPLEPRSLHQDTHASGQFP